MNWISNEASLYITKAWQVLVLFLVPIGGGIPAGVILARDKGFAWPMMTFLYFLSDIILAFIFEPLMWLFKRFRIFDRLREILKKSQTQRLSKKATSPLALVMISFGVDPMTGRAAALAAGHGFLMGWVFAITGDMFFFAAIMGSTLWLDSYLGDGTWTAVIITLAVLFLPGLFQKIKNRVLDRRKA